MTSRADEQAYEKRRQERQAQIRFPMGHGSCTLSQTAWMGNRHASVARQVASDRWIVADQKCLDLGRDGPITLTRRSANAARTSFSLVTDHQPLATDVSQKLLRRVVKSRENGAQMRVAEMKCNRLAYDATKIGGERQIAAFIELYRVEPRPSAIDTSTAHRTAKNEHHVSMAVIGAAITVL